MSADAVEQARALLEAYPHGCFLLGTIDAGLVARAYLDLREAGWEPIETAPKQTLVLLWALTDTETGNWKMASGHWCPGYQDEPGEWEWDGRRLKAYDVQPNPLARSALSSPLVGFKQATRPQERS